MYDVFRSRYTFACPARGKVQVSLSSFRQLVRLPGAAHPALYQVEFQCSCGDVHSGLVADDDLDWAPLGLTAGTFVNLMTSRRESAAFELAEVSAVRIKAGEWPWSFFCYPEERPRPVFPSSFALLAPGGNALGVAVRCPVCLRVSVNLVSTEHVDLPFHNDPSVGVVAHVFAEDVPQALEEFRAELDSSAFDVRRLALE
jgi:hypothetical protein